MRDELWKPFIHQGLVVEVKRDRTREVDGDEVVDDFLEERARHLTAPRMYRHRTVAAGAVTRTTGFERNRPGRFRELTLQVPLGVPIDSLASKLFRRRALRPVVKLLRATSNHSLRRPLRRHHAALRKGQRAAAKDCRDGKTRIAHTRCRATERPAQLQDVSRDSTESSRTNTASPMRSRPSCARPDKLAIS